MASNKIIYVPNYKNIEEKITYKDNVLNVVFVPFHSENLMPMGIIMIIKNITENEKLNNMRRSLKIKQTNWQSELLDLKIEVKIWEI